jgi:hypothetical protein
MTATAEYEARFRRAGLPLFIEDYSPASDVFNRAVPILGFVFIAELLGAIDLEWSLEANLAAVLGGLAILLFGIAAVNRLRGRPFRSLPRTVGWPELAVFVLLPALLPLIFGGQWRSAVVTLLGNLLLLGLILGVVGFGLVSIIRWALTRLLRQLAASLALLMKAVPLLMIFAVVLFLTTEVWQVFTEADDVSLAILGCLFVTLGTVFLVARLPGEVKSLEREAGDSGPSLRRRQRVNVGLVLFVSQTLQVLFVSLSVGAFFVVFGLLAIDAEILRAWIGSGGNVLASLEIGGREAILTEELLRVSAAIAAFTGLYFAISMLTDEVYRREFLDELTAEMRASFRDRAEYLRLLSGSA